MTPNQLEEALFIKENTANFLEKQVIPLLPKNDGGINAIAIEKFKNQASIEYCENWKEFFVDFKKQMILGFDQVVMQNNHLYKQNIDLKRSLQVVEQEIEIMRQVRINKEEISIKRKNAVSKDLREAINEKEFQETLKLVQQNHFVAGRKKGALILLYVTGLRVSNLLKFTVKNMKEFFDKGETLIDLIKKGKKKHNVVLSEKSCQLIKTNHQHFFQLMESKNDEQYLFTTTANLHKPINRSSFDTELNKVLIKASHKFQKHIRTHSFRASIITDFLKSTPIDVVKEIIGHKDIKTTLHYKRGDITPQQLRSVMQNLDKQRFTLSST